MRKYFVLVAALLFMGCEVPSVNNINFQSGYPANVTAVQISDLHINREKNIYDSAIDRINKINPDLLFITGDTIEADSNLPLMKKYFIDLQITCPVYAILGNWEYWGHVDIANFRRELACLGIELLVNEYRSYTKEDITIGIYGLDDYLGGKPDFSGFVSDKAPFNIVLGHCPALFDELKPFAEGYSGKTIMLSGHTHGGQITLFGLPLFLPEGSGAYVSGMYGGNNVFLYVSAGIGNSSVDLRLFADPHIELISF